MTTLVYRYGLLPPIDGAERVAEQMRGAHRYQNTLIEIERARREAWTAVVTSVLPPEMEERVAHLTEQIDTMLKVPKATRDKGALALLRGERRAAYEAVKIAKKAVQERPDVVERLATIATESHARCIAARAACGIYWGSYLLVEAAMDAAKKEKVPPRFRRWDGTGTVAVQLQGGLSTAKLFTLTDTRLQIDLTLRPIPERAGKPRPTLSLRVGTVEGGREPVWARWPIVFHRDLPVDAVIKWAKVHRRRIGTREEWSLLLTLETEMLTEPCGTGAVALDLRWSQDQAAGALRAATWHGEDGASGEMHLAPEVLGGLAKADDIRSIRDQHVEELRAALVAWRAGASETLSEELRERLTGLPQWRAAARFASLALWWREHRFDGDGSIYDLLEVWRKRDKHLLLYEAGARTGALRRRQDTYRNAAAMLARRYGTLVIERLDLAVLAKIPLAPEDRGAPIARTQRTAVAPSELRLAVVNAFKRRGGRVVTVPAGRGSTLLASYANGEAVEPPEGAVRTGRFKRLREAKTLREIPAE